MVQYSLLFVYKLPPYQGEHISKKQLELGKALTASLPKINQLYGIDSANNKDPHLFKIHHPLAPQDNRWDFLYVGYYLLKNMMDSDDFDFDYDPFTCDFKSVYKLFDKFPEKLKSRVGFELMVVNSSQIREVV